MPDFFCLHIPHFAAWALAQSESALRKRPFAVCESGVVVAASPLALDGGVAAGQSSGKAQSRLSALLLVSRDISRETLAWEEVQRAFYGLTPQVEPVAPGLLFAGLEAKRVKPLIAGWACHGGQAQDRATAQLAALSAPVGQSRVVPVGREATFSDLTPLVLLQKAGVSEAALQRLSWFGWKTVGALRVLSRRQLEEQVGAEGLTLHRFAQGPKLRENGRPVATWNPPEEVSAALGFEFPAREPCEWEAALDQILERACEALGPRSARTLEVRLETPLAPLGARRVLKEPTSQARLLQAPARAALGEGLQLLGPLPPVIQGIEVRLGALSCPPLQTSLFQGQAAEKTGQPQRLHAAFEEMERRFTSREGKPLSGHYVPDQSDSPFPEEVWRFESTSGWLRALESLQGKRKLNQRENQRENQRNPGQRKEAR